MGKRSLRIFNKRCSLCKSSNTTNFYTIFWITTKSTVYSQWLSTNGVTKSHDIKNSRNHSSMWLWHRIHENIVLSKRRLRRQPNDMITHERKNVILHTTTIKYHIFTKPKVLLLFFACFFDMYIYITINPLSLFQDNFRLTTVLLEITWT